MNIELSYTEAVDIKHALMCYIKEANKVIQDENYQKQYPNCTKALKDLIERDEALLERIRQELTWP